MDIDDVWDMTLAELRAALLRLRAADVPVYLGDWIAEGLLPHRADLITAVLGEAWWAAEYPENAADADEWTAWFRGCSGADHIVGDGTLLPRPTTVPTLYRGGKRLDRMSWTTDYALAHRYARGLAFRPPDGTVWAIHDLDPALVLARLDGRSESEWVIDIQGYAGVPEVVDEPSSEPTPLPPRLPGAGHHGVPEAAPIKTAPKPKG